MRIRMEGPAGVSEEALAEEFRAARDLGRARVGASGVFFTKLSGTGFLPWEAVERAWLRQEEVSARLCCGRASFDQFYLMILGKDGRERRAQLLNGELGRQALAQIRQAAPGVAVGRPERGTDRE